MDVVISSKGLLRQYGATVAAHQPGESPKSLSLKPCDRVDEYRVTHQVGDYILLTLNWQFQCLPYSAWAAANLAELACHVAKKVEQPKQGQQNIVADLVALYTASALHPSEEREG